MHRGEARSYLLLNIPHYYGAPGGAWCIEAPSGASKLNLKEILTLINPPQACRGGAGGFRARPGINYIIKLKKHHYKVLL